MAKEATRESVIDRLVKNTRQKYGKITEGAGTDLSKRFYSGLRLPHLCMQYLVCANIFPLNSIVQLRGPRDTLKSALAIQIGRWFIDNGGDFVYGDAENKAPMDIVDSILETPNAREDHPRFHHFPVHSAPEAQQLIQLNIAASKEANVEIAAHNESHPDDYWEPLCVMVLLDSFVAALSEEDKAKIEREGSSDRIAPYGKIWSRTIAKLKSDLVDSNATLVIINHERPSPGNIYAGIQVPGPTALGYLEALDIRTGKASGVKNEAGQFAEERKKVMKLTTARNAAGESGREIPAIEFTWDIEKNFHFDFELADIELISSYLSGDRTLGPLEDIKKWGGKYSCPSLGIDKRVGANELFQVITENEEIMEDIRKKWGIAERPVFNEVEEEEDG